MVKCASPQGAPTAPAAPVFIALSSVCQNALSVSAVRKFNGWVRGRDPASLFH